LESHKLNAEGVLNVLRKLHIDFAKVMWYTRDGASVMSKLVRLLIE